MQLNELREQYKEKLRNTVCQFEIEDRDNNEDIILNSDAYNGEDPDYMNYNNGKQVPAEIEDTMDYITEESSEYYEENVHDDENVAESFIPYETNNICDNGICKKKEERADERPGFFGFVSRFFQPLFAIAP